MRAVLTFFKCLIGFALACLTAGLVQVLFVITPLDIISLPVQSRPERLASAGALSLYAAVQAAVFTAPMALFAIAFGLWQRIRSALFYMFVGLAFGIMGFAAQYVSEVQGQPSIVNVYALAAYATAGAVAGWVYWLIAAPSARAPRRDRVGRVPDKDEAQAVEGGSGQREPVGDNSA